MTVRASILDDEQFRRGLEKLSENQLTITEFESTHICGTIDCNSDGLLYTSIPQDGSWHAYVDGMEVEPVLVGDVMLAVPVTEGSHNVEFIYRNDAFEIGWKISTICLLLFGLTAPLCYRKRKKGRFEK